MEVMLVGNPNVGKSVVFNRLTGVGAISSNYSGTTVDYLKADMMVNGKKFNGVMSPLPAKYTDQDVADILTYVYGNWGNPGGSVSVADVKKNRVKVAAAAAKAPAKAPAKKK